MSGHSISFVIPAFNEGRLLATALAAVHSAVGGTCEYEIVVVDNGSGDDTADVAARGGARVLSRPEGTISFLRNEGVRSTTGEYLVFLDADVVVTNEWGRQLPDTLKELSADARRLTGGMCAIPADASWIERVWFGPREPEAASHIGSGHLVMTRSFFDEVGGFDESFETGEDYDLSRRAVAAGGRIAPEPSLVAVHLGYPKTLLEFVRREVWHGRGDFTSIRAVLASKVAVASFVFGLAHIAMVAGLVIGSRVAVLIGAGSIVAICVGSSWIRYGKRSWVLGLSNSGLFYFYLAARLFAFGSRGKGWRRVEGRK